ncbi:MAG: NYN domain-containing protein [Hyphomicrobiaceae bacterium]
MSIHLGERTFAFIDGPNLHATVRALGFEIDYRKLLEHLRSQGHLIRVLYYTAIVEDQEFSTFRPLADWLDYNGYTMVTKPARGYTDATGRRRFRTSMDVELAVDAMRLADKADHIILFSGEQSFASLVSALQQMGKRVTVISTIETQPAMVADELRRQADHFIDIDTLQSQIARLGRTPRPSHGFEREDRFRRHSADEERTTEEHAASTAPDATQRDVPEAAAQPHDGGQSEVPRDEPRDAPDGSLGDEHSATSVESAAAPPTPVVRTVRRRRTQV